MNSTPQRALAIDVMRGMTVALMITVNMSISDVFSYGPLLHSEWNGLTITDIVFPTFLFVVGAALTFTLEKYQALGEAALLKKTFTRTAIIFLCGYLLGWFPFFEFNEAGQLGLIPVAHTRILGVLHRIALGYCMATLIVHYGKQRGAIVYSVGALLGYWWIMAALGDYTLIGNAALKLDRLVLGDAHLYHGEIYPPMAAVQPVVLPAVLPSLGPHGNPFAFDPEGILGTFPAVVNVLAGYFAMSFVRRKGTNYETIAKLLLAAAAFVVVALCWDLVFPINKKLWTSSYVLCTIGIDLAILGALVYAVDLSGMRRGTYFFEVFGKNTLFIYLLSEVLNSVLWITPVGNITLFEWIYSNAFQGWASDKFGSLIFALIFMLSLWLVGYAMDKKKRYVRI